jgi:hypothetical protein
MRYVATCAALACCAFLFFVPVGLAVSQEPAAVEPLDPETDAKPKTELPREQRIANYLTGSKFVGSFSVDSQGFGQLKEEAYTISKVEKLPEADSYRLTARIQYGETDGEFPMDLKILWAGNTPVITLDQVWIPGLGTFSARVLILKDRYAGTWDHDAVGGHLFGRIEKAEAKP